MNIPVVLRVVAAISVIVGLVMSTGIAVAVAMGDSAAVVWQFIVASAITIVVGLLGLLIRPKQKDVRFREGFGIVTFSWLAASLFGAIPFMLAGGLSFVDSWFETMSGFTTTGASIMRDIEAMPKAVLYWRSMTHWLGGMGIVVLSLAILPILGIGGMQLYKAEAPGPTSDQLAPRIASTAKLLWGVYVLLSAAEFILLSAHPDMGIFEAWCHTAATLATGGFSTRNASIAAYASPYIEWVIIVFMFLAGANFALHLRALMGKPFGIWKDDEFRFYVYLILFAILTIAVSLYVHDVYARVSDIIRHASFAVVSIMTTTGFGTENWDTWPFYCRALLVLLMFVGGCGGSTGGGMKVSRILLTMKYAIAQLRKSFYPRMILNIRLHDQRVPSSIMDRVLSFALIYIGVFLVVGLLVTVIEPRLHALQAVEDEAVEQVLAENSANQNTFDAGTYGGLETAFGASIACLSNIGPGLGQVGPSKNFAWMAPQTKILLLLTMLIGRLEIYTAIVLLLPSFWRK